MTAATGGALNAPIKHSQMKGCWGGAAHVTGMRGNANEPGSLTSGFIFHAIFLIEQP